MRSLPQEEFPERVVDENHEIHQQNSIGPIQNLYDLFAIHVILLSFPLFHSAVVSQAQNNRVT